MALSQSENYPLYQEEMEGLNLTEENADDQMEGDGQMLEQPEGDLYRINHLSSIGLSQDNTVISTLTKQIHRQQEDLDQVEANLEQEVQQLNMIYA